MTAGGISDAAVKFNREQTTGESGVVQPPRRKVLTKAYIMFKTVAVKSPRGYWCQWGMSSFSLSYVFFPRSIAQTPTLVSLEWVFVLILWMKFQCLFCLSFLGASPPPDPPGSLHSGLRNGLNSNNNTCHELLIRVCPVVYYCRLFRQ